ncbi:MAG: hypothetical protein ABNH30_05305 [Thalassolituus sp.]
MEFEDFVALSAITEMQVSSLYFKPNIPQDKLANAIRAYAPNVGMSTVVALIDESFWGNAKEGALITNEGIILSKKLGGHEIPFNTISQISIVKKNLIINDRPLAKLTNPELMPLGALGSTLNEFAIYTRKAKEINNDALLIDEPTTKKLASFLETLTVPTYFESTPEEHRKKGGRTTNYVLGSEITSTQSQIIRFKGGLAPNETILCASWLDGHGDNDYFFCVTNNGVYSVISEKPGTFISHEEMRTLTAEEEYKESRYVGARMSNGKEIIVSIQNAYIRPYALELFAGLIDILNNNEPAETRTIHNTPNQASCQKNVSATHSPHPSPNHNSSENAKNKYLNNDLAPTPLINHEPDQIFQLITNLNTLENVGDFVGSIFSTSDNANSQIKKKFQSFAVRSATSFRKEVVEQGGFQYFRNNAATMEVIGLSISFLFINMLERGVTPELAERIILEGIRATFAIEGSAQRDKHGSALLKIIDSYLETENEEDIFINFIVRLIGSNLAGSLRPDYNEIVQDKAEFLDDFVPTMDPGLTRFMKKMGRETSNLIDHVLDAKW